MSDLISRQEVEKAIKDYFKMIIDNTDDDIDCVLGYNKNLCDAIRDIPTAYDVEKVVGQLDKESVFAEYEYIDTKDQDYSDCGHIIELASAIEIVKRGGKDE